MIEGIDHVGIAVNSLKEAVDLYCEIFGMKASPVREYIDDGMRSVMLTFGEDKLEIMEPIDPQGNVAKFLKTRGEGIHHISLRVVDIDKKLEVLAEKGIKTIDEKGRQINGAKMGFVHPRSTRGVLIELCERA